MAVETLAVAIRRKQHSPFEVLLKDMGVKGFTVKHLILGLHNLQHETAQKLLRPHGNIPCP